MTNESNYDRFASTYEYKRLADTHTFDEEGI